MKPTDILPGAGLKRMVEGFLETVAQTLRRLRRGGMYEYVALGQRIGLLNRIQTLLRLALLIIACNLDLEPAPTRAAARRRPPSRKNAR